MWNVGLVVRLSQFRRTLSTSALKCLSANLFDDSHWKLMRIYCIIHPQSQRATLTTTQPNNTTTWGCRFNFFFSDPLWLLRMQDVRLTDRVNLLYLVIFFSSSFSCIHATHLFSCHFPSSWPARDGFNWPEHDLYSLNQLIANLWHVLWTICLSWTKYQPSHMPLMGSGVLLFTPNHVLGILPSMFKHTVHCTPRLKSPSYISLTLIM